MNVRLVISSMVVSRISRVVSSFCFMGRLLRCWCRFMGFGGLW